MNRHYREGFTRVFTNDLNNVEEQLQAFDPELYIMWNPHTGEHLIMDGVTELAIMRIPQQGFPFLSSRVVSHIRSIRVGEVHSAVRMVEEHERQREIENDRRVSEIASEFAREMYRADKRSVVMGASS